MRGLLSGAILAGAMMAGCGDDDVRHYTVPKATAPAQLPAHGDMTPHAAGTPQRLLGAIITHGDRVWFLKSVGPDARVGEEKDAFIRFLSSVRFNDAGEPPVTWTIPDGWRQKPASGIRFATLLLGTHDPPLEMSITPLGAEGGAASVLANVNRWRDQLGLPAVDEAGLLTSTTQMDVSGSKATVVDITGAGPAHPAMMPPFAGASEGLPPAHPPIETAPAAPTPSGPASAGTPGFTSPPGWLEQPAGGMISAAWSVPDGANQAKVTVVPLDGAAGGFAANVNRWRNQVGLPPAADDVVRSAAQSLEVSGAAASYLDIAGPESAGAARQRILGVVAERGGRTWFFKMQGPHEIVGRHKGEFESFVKSVRF